MDGKQQIHLMHQWYSLSDPAKADALIEVSRMGRFARCGKHLCETVITDASLPLVRLGDRIHVHNKQLARFEGVGHWISRDPRKGSLTPRGRRREGPGGRG
jgi:IS5 family transposase